MKISDIMSPKCVLTGVEGKNVDDVVKKLIAAIAEIRAVDEKAALKDIELRERAGSTLIPVGKKNVAIPHALTNSCNQLVMAIGISNKGIPWRAGREETANIVVLLLGPQACQPYYLRVLSRIARVFDKKGFIESVMNLKSPHAVLRKLASLEEEFGEMRHADDQPRFCVLGAGHGGMAMAGHLALSGFQVTLFNRTPDRIRPLAGRGGIEVTGEVSGFAPLHLITSDPAEALANSDVLMVVVPATAHREMAGLIAPHVNDGHIIVLNPGRTGGAMEVAQVLREVNPSVKPYIAEAQTLLYAARVTNPGQVHIFRIKNSVPLATLPAYHVADVLPMIRKALPQFVPGDNVLKTSLDNVGAVFHPAITILNAGRIEDTHGDFEYYVEGVTPAVADVLEAIDRERVEVASALGIRAHTAREWLYLAYDAAGRTLYEAMMANRGYRGIQAPGTIQHRYISEDVPASLVPIASIGNMFGIKTPYTDSMIHLASVMHGVDYFKTGRTVRELGIEGMSVKELRFMVVGAGPPIEQPAPQSAVMSIDADNPRE